MKKSETIKIIERLICMYPSFKFGELPEEMGGGELDPIEFWHEQIGDMEFEKAVEATKISIDNCKFVPSAADIREAYNKIVEAEKKQMGNFRTYYQYCRDIYPKELPPDYGWQEFLDKVHSAKPEKWEQAAKYIYDNMKKIVYNGETVPEFIEIIKETK